MEEIKFKKSQWRFAGADEAGEAEPGQRNTVTVMLFLRCIRYLGTSKEEERRTRSPGPGGGRPLLEVSPRVGGL